ncbi:hypothetical protein A3F57_03390 [Candidatus Roizmanbacteria bacterium RIFCSPHIGHO2_12_FULL_36_11]|nr:MAG: hypothetical protein A3F57_03390 [Candidatus Roizmanbacteria bacterium RIFCSPHIGHO2_12_FULL_36_11]
MRLKILSWNIWYHGDLAKINEFLERFNADILGLQEVMMVDKKIQLSEHITDKLGYKYIYAPAFQIPINGLTTDVGNAIFTKNPILNRKIHNLSETDNRIAIQADVQMGNETLHIFNTHLLHTHQQPSEIQDLQASNLVKVLASNNTVLMGDFNALPESKAIRIINKAVKNTDAKSLPTWSVYPDGCKVCSPKGIIYKLDNIFVSKDIRSSSFKVKESRASDHLPISVVIEV